MSEGLEFFLLGLGYFLAAITVGIIFRKHLFEYLKEIDRRKR